MNFLLFAWRQNKARQSCRFCLFVWHRYAQQLFLEAFEAAEDAVTVHDTGMGIGNEFVLVQIGPRQSYDIAGFGGFKKPFKLLNHFLVGSYAFRLVWPIEADNFG